MAVSDAGFRVIERAVQIRLAKLEKLDDIIASYQKLSAEQVAQLKEKYSN